MKKYVGIIFVLIAGLLWGTMGVFVKFFTARNFTSIDTALVRVGIAAILLLSFNLIKNPKLLKIKLKHIWCFIGSGCLSLLFFSLCYFETIVQSSMSVAAVLLYIAPVFVMLMSRVVFKTRITLVKVVAIVLSVLGCALVSGIVGYSESISMTALLLGLGSAFGYSLYSIFSKFALQFGYPSITVTTYTFVFAALGLLFFADVDFVIANTFTGVSTGIMTILAGLVSGALPYIFYTKGLEKTEPGKASVVASVEPVFATVISVVFYDEHLSVLQSVGIALVIISIVLIEMGLPKFLRKSR